MHCVRQAPCGSRHRRRRCRATFEERPHIVGACPDGVLDIRPWLPLEGGEGTDNLDHAGLLEGAQLVLVQVILLGAGDTDSECGWLPVALRKPVVEGSSGEKAESFIRRERVK
jgi:hypothetical protein